MLGLEGVAAVMGLLRLAAANVAALGAEPQVEVASTSFARLRSRSGDALRCVLAAAHRISRSWRATARSPLTVPQVTSTGQVPDVAAGSTVQVQETPPPPSASFGASPSALLWPVG